MKTFNWVVILMLVLRTASAQEEEFKVYAAPEKLGTGVNSPYYELNPVMNADGTALYFSRHHHPDNIGGADDPADIWISDLLPDGSWSVARNAGAPLNDEGENLIIGFMDEGRAMLLHHRAGFAFSYFVDDQWLEPSPYHVPFFSSKGPEKWGSVSYNGRYIVFALETFGTYGVEDIYMTQLRPDGTWASLKNLGGTINTDFQEVTPFLAPDNKTLFFSSNGHGGVGSFDVFMSQRLDDSWRNWSPPKNLGRYANSPGAEMGFQFLPNSDYAYLTSTQDSEGYSDIKKVRIAPGRFAKDTTEVERTEPVAVNADPTDLQEEELAFDNLIFYKGVLVDHKNNSPLTGKVVFQGDGGFEVVVNSFVDGRFTAELPKDHVWEMTIDVGNYLKVDTTFQLSDNYSADQINTFYLEPLTVGNKITLKHVLFYRGTANLVEGSEKELRVLYETMISNPQLKILLEGHTDNRGDFDLNVQLSTQRVEVVKDYLVRKGIEASRIEGKGYGGLKPIASNDAESTRMLNRRVEFTIISN